jgi:circadian clock protein KaiC
MATNPPNADGQSSLERVPTGIPGLDTILRGGLLKSGIYILHGEPGKAVQRCWMG